MSAGAATEGCCWGDTRRAAMELWVINSAVGGRRMGSEVVGISRGVFGIGDIWWVHGNLQDDGSTCFVF